MSLSRAIVRLHFSKSLTNRHRFLTTSTYKNVLGSLGRPHTSHRQFKRLDSVSFDKLIFDGCRSFSVARGLHADTTASQENASTVVPEISKSGEDYFIPEPPQAPVSVDETGSELIFNHLGEPTFQSLGIGTSYFPTDFILKFLETLHVSGDLPWWGVLGIATVIVRVVMFPLVLNFRRKSAEFANNMPAYKALQDRLDSARLQNNILEMTKVSSELNEFMKERGIISAKNLVFFPLLNGLIIISFLSAIRKMANYPVASMQDGGLFWFADLTLPDAFCLLPLTCAASALIIMEIGADMTKTSSQKPVIQYVMRGFPVVMFFFIMNMPAAVTYYFTLSNMISISQTLLMKTEKTRKFLNIPNEIKAPPMTSTTVGNRKLGFWDSMKESKRRAEMLRMVAERERLDDERFRSAGKALVKKTVPLDLKKTASSKNPPKELKRA